MNLLLFLTIAASLLGKGTHYFIWSEDDTRSPTYQVRYGTAEAMLGKITALVNNLVISK